MRTINPAALALLLLCGACEGRVVGWPNNMARYAPTVTWTTPEDGEVDVALNTTLMATFSEEMDPDTLLLGNFTLSRGSDLVLGAVRPSGEAGVRFTPTFDLDPDAEYTARLTTDLTDRSGQELAQDYTWDFTTGTDLDLLAPHVIFTDPQDDADDADPGAAIYATFSEAMDPDTLSDASFTLTGPGAAEVEGAVAYNETSQSASFTPMDDLSEGDTYTATITVGATDLAGNPMLAEHTWTFQVPDETSPWVVSTEPADSDGDVDRDVIVTATFNETMDPDTLTEASFTLTGPGVMEVEGAVAYIPASRTATFTPLADLAEDTIYTATITVAATDLAGNPLLLDHSWIFAVPDATAPTVLFTDPEDGETHVGLDAEVMAFFSEDMDPFSISTSTFTLEGPGGLDVSGRVIYDAVEQMMLFTPDSELESETEYTATLSTGALDASGNPMADDYIWEFETADREGPRVTEVDPEDGDREVYPGSNVYVTFSEDINPLTVSELSFEVEGSDGVLVSGEVSYEVASRIATFDPDSDWETGRTYTATISTDVWDLSGNPMEEPYVWSFSTENEIGVDLGSLSTFVAVAGAGLTNSNSGGTTTLGGDVGLSPTGSCLGDGVPCTATNPVILGTLYAADSVSALAKADLLDAYAEAMSYAPGTVVSDLSGMTLAPGVYTAGSTLSMAVGGTVVLDADGDANAVWIFQVGSSLTVGNDAEIQLIDGADARNVFWAVAASSTIGTNVHFEGTVLAGASSSMGVGSEVVGRLLCTDGAITLLSNTVTLPTD